MTDKLYAQRDAYNLDCESGEVGCYYCKHIQAMTAEGLHGKSEIAAELAVRDAQIDYLVTLLTTKIDGGYCMLKEDVLAGLPQFYIETGGR